jgi:hypothetical protein
MLCNSQMSHWTRLETTQVCSLNKCSLNSRILTGHLETTQACSLNTLLYACSLNALALSPISVIRDIGLSLMSKLPISDWESGVRHYIRYRNKVLSDIPYPTSRSKQTVSVASCYSARLLFQGARDQSAGWNIFFGLQCRISKWTLMSIS